MPRYSINRSDVMLQLVLRRLKIATSATTKLSPSASAAGARLCRNFVTSPILAAKSSAARMKLALKRHHDGKILTSEYSRRSAGFGA